MTTATNSNDLSIIPGAEPTGLLTYYVQSGVTSFAKLKESLEAAGVDEKYIPNAPSASHVIEQVILDTKAFLAAQNRTDILARRFGSRATGVKVGLVEEVPGEDDVLRHKHLATITVTKEGPRVQVLDESARELAAYVVERYNHHADSFGHSSFYLWTSKLFTAVDAIMLKRHGGVYYIPATATATFNTIANVVNSSTACHFYSIPVVKSSDAVEAIMGSLEAESNTALDDFYQEYTKAVEAANGDANKIPDRFTTRLSNITAKVQKYETLLGTSLDKLREHMTNLQTAVAENRLL